MTRPARPAAWDDVPRPALPALWVLAALWVWLTSTARAAHDLLVIAERWYEAAGRAVARGFHALLRALGPLGRSLWRLLGPVLVELQRVRGLVFRWVREQVLPRLVRAAVLVWEWSRPLRRQVVAVLGRLAVRMRPLLLVLGGMTATLRRVLLRVAAWWRRRWVPVVRAARRAWAPVVRAARELRQLLPRLDSQQP